jgi:hypothetical protein
MPDQSDAKPPPSRVLKLRRDDASPTPAPAPSIADLATAVLGFAEPKAAADTDTDPAQPAARVSSLAAMATPQRGRKALSFARPDAGRDGPEADVQALPVRTDKPRTE